MYMRASVFRICLVAAAMLSPSAATHAQIYRWFDESGSRTYSNSPPPDAQSAKDLIVIEDRGRSATPAAVPLPRAPELPSAVFRPSEAATSAVTPTTPSVGATTDSSPPRKVEMPSSAERVDMDGEPAATFTDRRTIIVPPTPTESPTASLPVARELEAPPVNAGRAARRTLPPEVARELMDPAPRASESSQRSAQEVEPPVRLFSEPEKPARASAQDGGSPETLGNEAETSARAKSDAPRKPRTTARLPEAVQDPCLRSSDPKCYEKHKDDYVPYRGYAPSVARENGADAPATGATSGAPGGGAIQGGSVPKTAAGKLTPPKSSDYALPPGSDTGRQPAKK